VFTNTEIKVQYLGDPITVGGVANINGLTVFDTVYATVRQAICSLARGIAPLTDQRKCQS
jgi:DeoR/GlpR family transcriptional regulator of sugar metabolism